MCDVDGLSDVAVEDVHRHDRPVLRGYRTRHQRRPGHPDDRQVHRQVHRGILRGRLRVEARHRHPQGGRHRSHRDLRDGLHQIRDAPLPHRVHPGGLGGRPRGDHRGAAGWAGRSSSAADAETGAAGWAYLRSSSGAWAAASSSAVRTERRSGDADRWAGSAHPAERSRLAGAERPPRQSGGPTQERVEGRGAQPVAARWGVRGPRRDSSPGGDHARSPAGRHGDRTRHPVLRGRLRVRCLRAVRPLRPAGSNQSQAPTSRPRGPGARSAALTSRAPKDW